MLIRMCLYNYLANEQIGQFDLSKSAHEKYPDHSVMGYKLLTQVIYCQIRQCFYP